MYSYRKDGISVLTVIDRRRRKNNRVQKYYPTGQDVTQDEGEFSFGKLDLSSN